jgi:phosphatidylinositol alpha-mannosyltransferase
MTRLHGRIAVSEPARRYISRYFPGPYDVIPNGVDVERFCAATPLPWAGASPTVLFVGRHEEPRKGLPELLRALPEVCRRVPGTRLVVAGTGDMDRHAGLMADLRLDTSGVVTFAGMVPAEEIPRYFASCDVYCSPATGNESFGIVLLEAMASGKPVVASDIAGYASVVTTGQEGALVPPEDPPALARALARLLLDPELRWRQGEAGRETAARYDWSRIAAQVLDAYEKAQAVARSGTGRRSPRLGGAPARRAGSRWRPGASGR